MDKLQSRSPNDLQLYQFRKVPPTDVTRNSSFNGVESESGTPTQTAAIHCLPMHSLKRESAGNTPSRDPVRSYTNSSNVNANCATTFVPASYPRGSVATCASGADLLASTLTSARLGSGRTCIASAIPGRPRSTMPEGNFTQYSFDVAKVLREYVRRRDENVLLRVLPKMHQLQQHVLQELCAREQMLLQEQTARLLVVSKFAEERARRQEQQQVKNAKERLDDLRKRQQAEIQEQRATATMLMADTEKEIRERLKHLQVLHPRLGPTSAALADVRHEQSDCAILAELLEEDKKLQKALRADNRFNKCTTAEADGGALSYWFRHCVVASFNVAAILQRSPLRASVQDVAAVGIQMISDRRVVVVRAAGDGQIVAWAHARLALSDVVAAGEAFATLTVSEDLPKDSGVGILWLKEDLALAIRAARAPKSTIADIASISKSILSVGSVASSELTAKDVLALGEAAAA